MERQDLLLARCPACLGDKAAVIFDGLRSRASDEEILATCQALRAKPLLLSAAAARLLDLVEAAVRVELAAGTAGERGPR